MIAGCGRTSDRVDGSVIAISCCGRILYLKAGDRHGRIEGIEGIEAERVESAIGVDGRSIGTGKEEGRRC